MSKFTTKYHDWVDAPECMSMSQNGSLNLLSHFLSNSCSISQRITQPWNRIVACTWLAEHVRNSQQNITTKWMPHSVCWWAKIGRSTYYHISWRTTFLTECRFYPTTMSASETCCCACARPVPTRPDSFVVLVSTAFTDGKCLSEGTAAQTTCRDTSYS